MINAGKLQTVENIEDLAIYIKETKNKNLEKEDLIQVNAMLALDVKWLKKKEVDDSKPGQVKTFYFLFLYFLNKYQEVQKYMLTFLGCVQMSNYY